MHFNFLDGYISQFVAITLHICICECKYVSTEYE